MIRRGMMRLAAMAVALLLALGCVSGLAEALSRGSKGDEVMELQDQLNRLGYEVGTADGDFGGKTEKALLAFQEDHGLEQTGALDDATSAAIAGELLDIETRRYEYYLGNHTWKEANARAIAMGGRLVNIDDMAELEELESELLEVGGADVTFWIGARRDDNASDTSKGFSWVDEQDRTLPAIADMLGDYNPWALGEPSYQNGEGEREPCVQLRFSPLEGRWVFEDVTGEPVGGGQYGFIVEYEDRRGRAVLEPSEVDLVKPLSFREEPEYQPKAVTAKAFAVTEVQTIEKYLYIKGSISEKEGVRNAVEYLIWRDDHGAWKDENLLFSGAKYVFGDMEDGWIRDGIDPETYEQLAGEPEELIVEARLYSLDIETEKVIQEGAYYRQKLRFGPEDCASVAGGDGESEEAAGGERSRTALYRVTPALASGGLAGPAAGEIEICDPSGGEPLAVTHAGEAVYLPASDYVARLAGDETVQAAFTASGTSVLVCLDDVGRAGIEGRVTDEETGEPMAGAEVVVENQGREYRAVTEEDGAFRIGGMASAESLLYVTGAGVDTDYAGLRIQLYPKEYKRVDAPVKATVPAAFFGTMHFGGQDWWNAYHKWESEGLWGPDSWFIGPDSYVKVDEVIYGPGEKDAQYDLAENVPGRKIRHEPDLGELLEELPFDMEGNDSDELVIRGHIQPDRILELNPTFAGFFMGWSDQIIDVVTSEDALLCPPKQAYFHILLECIKGGEDPMNDDVFEAIFRRRLEQCGFDEGQCNEVVDVLKAAPQKYKELYLLSFYDYALEGNSKKRKAAGRDLADGAYCPPLTNGNGEDNTLYILDTLDPREFECVFFHESGHAAEMNMINPKGKTFEESAAFPDIEGRVQAELEKAVRKAIGDILDDIELGNGLWGQAKLTEEEKRQIINAFINGGSLSQVETRNFWDMQSPAMRLSFEMVQTKLSKMLEDIVASVGVESVNANMVVDLYAGVTANKINGQWGHEELTYWYRENGPTYMQLMEGWAEYYSAMIRNDTENMALNKRYFETDESDDTPGISYMEALATRLREYYLDKYTEEYDGMPVKPRFDDGEE